MIKEERRAVFHSTKEKGDASTCGRRLEVECPVRHLDESSSEGCEVECPARHLEGDRGQKRGNFREKGVRAVNRPASGGW